MNKLYDAKKSNTYFDTLDTAFMRYASQADTVLSSFRVFAGDEEQIGTQAEVTKELVGTGEKDLVERMLEIQQQISDAGTHIRESFETNVDAAENALIEEAGRADLHLIYDEKTEKEIYDMLTGTSGVPYSLEKTQELLCAPYSKNAEKHYYQLTCEYEFATGKAAPWFGFPGGGRQYVIYSMNGEKVTIDTMLYYLKIIREVYP